jgi:ferredoxin-NADP reductase
MLRAHSAEATFKSFQTTKLCSVCVEEVEATLKFETQVKDIVPRTYNVKSFRFPRPLNFNYLPGQFMFITIRTEKGELKKHFTISSSPTETDHLEFTKKLTGSTFSNALDSLKIEDWTKIDGPNGDFTFTGEHPKIGLLSGGIGITPLRSICRYCTDKKLAIDIVLLYGNRTEQDIVFREELERMQTENKNLKVILIVSEATSTWKGHTGRINEDMMKQEIPDFANRMFYTCGPPAMVEAMTTLLQNLKVPENQIRTENFPGYT